MPGRVVIDGTGEYIDHDVKEAIYGFAQDAMHRQIKVTIVGIDMAHAQGSGGH